MSESMRRKSSSRQLLQNLISVTAERSQEDAEEVERERRRRARETQRGEGGPSRREPPQHDELRAHGAQLDEELKPRCNLVQEEDEGFSDWSHKLENRGEQEVQDVSRRPSTRRKPEPGEEKQQKGEEEEEKEVKEGCEPERSSRSKEASSRPPQKMTCAREEVRMSYSSTVFVSQDARLQHTDRTSYLVAGTMRPRGACRVDGEVEQEEQKEEVQAALQRESAETQRSSRDEEDHEDELSFRREEEECLYLRGEEEKEEHRMLDKSWMKSRRGEEARRRSEEARSEETRKSEEASRRSEEARSEEARRRSEEARSEETRKSEEASRRSEEARSEEARRRSEEARSEETRKSEEASRRSEEARSEEARRRSEEARSEEPCRRSDETRKSEEASRRSEEARSEEASRRSAASLCCSSDGEESLNYGPMSPTFKKLLIQFYPDEVNSRVSTDGKCSIMERTESLRKSTSHIKKTPSPVAVSKIDKKLELYAQALEVSSKDGRPGGQAPTDLTSPAEPVSSRKSLFEAGDTWRHDAPPGAPSKDADGLKVGVANLINQWVRGSEGGSRCSSPCRPAENSSGKRSKFVVTGHGKYEKVPVEDCREEAPCPPGGHFYEDL
ncbi:lymphocyte-specific protein 1-like isoform X2 [Pungitius pungitius]|uniref:lymphocyte-specific protein 1-like isoform X2 n=1 Tax=Pungitius pungitius TaxID=134920 RepID=UPI002E124225